MNIVLILVVITSLNKITSKAIKLKFYKKKKINANASCRKNIMYKNDNCNMLIKDTKRLVIPKRST